MTDPLLENSLDDAEFDVNEVEALAPALLVARYLAARRKGMLQADIEADILAQVQTEVEQTILVCGPEQFTDGQANAVALQSLSYARGVLDVLALAGVANSLDLCLVHAVAEAKRLVGEMA